MKKLLLLFSLLATPALALDGAAPRLTTALTNSAQTLFGASARLAWYQCLNPSNAAAYVQLFDTTSAVVLGTTVPNAVVSLYTNESQFGMVDLNFFTGVKVAATTTAAGSSAPSAALTCTFGLAQ